MTDFRQYDSMSVSVSEPAYTTGEFQTGQAITPSGAVAVARSPIFWIRRELTEALLRVIRNWWLVLGVWCVLAMGLGYLVATVFGKQTWRSKVTMLYTAPSTSDPDYSSIPNLKTLQGLAKYEPFIMKTIEVVSKDSDRPEVVTLPIPPKVLNTAIQVNSPPGTNSLELTLGWDTRDGANYLLGQFVDSFQQGVQDYTRQKAEKQIQELNRQIQDAEANLKKMVEEQNNALKQNQITDVKGDQAAVKEAISSLEYRLRMSNADEIGAKVEYDAITKKLEDMKKDAQKDAESEDQDQALADTISDTRRRQDRIRELITDEKELISLKAELEEKNLKRVRLENLLMKNAVAKEDVDQVIAEIRTIKAKMDGDKKTVEWNNEMMNLDKAIVPQSKKKMKTNPIITQTLDKQLERELTLMSIQVVKDHLMKEIEAQKQRMAKISSLESSFEESAGRINAARLAVSNLMATKNALASRVASPKSPLDSLSPPDTGEYAAGSTKPLLFGITSLGAMCFGLFSLLGWEVFARAGTPSNLARRLEIPVPDLRSRPEELARQSRNLSRQLRQRDPGQGMILTVHPVAATETCIEKALGVAKELGGSFSKRGERVLIIQLESGVKGSATMGLSDYLYNRVDSPAMVIRPTEDLSCDILPSGTEPLDADSLANQRMSEFMEQARERYGVIIIVGHPLNNLHEVEILAANSQSIVLVADGEKTVDADAREALFELSRMKAPVSAMMIR